jgi:hypothetical protein
MDNRYFRASFTASFTAGLVMMVFGGAVLMAGATYNKAEFIFSIILFSTMLPFAIWGLINLIKGRKVNG